MGKAIARIDRRLEGTVLWLDEVHIGPVLRVALAVVVALIPTAQAFSGSTLVPWMVPLLKAFADPEWLIAFLASLVLLVPLQHYHKGGPVRRLLGGLASINGSFAGALITLESKIDASSTRQLHDAECEALCTALLHRIRDYAAVALDASDGPNLRATLAVPYSTTGSQTADALRVWCYDQPYEKRGYTIIPFYIEESVAPGAPAAYFDVESWQIINDIEAVPGIAARSARPYRSVVSFAVPAKDGNGKPLAVVSIDADEPNFFQLNRVLTELRPLVSPVASAIGLVLSSRKTKGGAYGFPA